MLAVKRLIFKFMEFGLGLKPYFSLETEDPIFINFRLSPDEASAVQASLPAGFTLKKVKFVKDDPSSEHWVSYNLYRVKYPKEELKGLTRIRCEINTFVEDSEGRKGILVFCGSPLVSKEKHSGVISRMCEMAERLVIFLYGCGRLVPLNYELSDRHLKVEFSEKDGAVYLSHDLPDAAAFDAQLSDDYLLYNDVSFFNQGKTYDLVNVNSTFSNARFCSVEGSTLNQVEVEGPFFRRRPDKVYVHRGNISYLVDALNRH